VEMDDIFDLANKNEVAQLTKLMERLFKGKYALTEEMQREKYLFLFLFIYLFLVELHRHRPCPPNTGFLWCTDSIHIHLQTIYMQTKYTHAT
jgi:hypothetical protein